MAKYNIRRAKCPACGRWFNVIGTSTECRLCEEERDGGGIPGNFRDWEWDLPPEREEEVDHDTFVGWDIGDSD